MQRYYLSGMPCPGNALPLALTTSQYRRTQRTVEDPNSEVAEYLSARAETVKKHLDALGNGTRVSPLPAWPAISLSLSSSNSSLCDDCHVLSFCRECTTVATLRHPTYSLTHRRLPRARAHTEATTGQCRHPALSLSSSTPSLSLPCPLGSDDDGDEGETARRRRQRRRR